MLFIPMPMSTTLTSSDSISMGFGEEIPGGLDNLAFFPEGTSRAGDRDLEAPGPLTRSGKSEADMAEVAEERRAIQ